MKEAIIKIKEVKNGSFFKTGYIIYEVIERIDGVEKSMGEYVFSPSNEYRHNEMKKEYSARGFKLLGQW